MHEVGEYDPVEAVAIIGLAGRFPGAKNVAEYWQNLVNGVESITKFSDDALAAAGVAPELLANPNYVKASGALSDVDLFDASFFGFTPREAQITDPQHRLLLECAWEALEDGGYVGETYPGAIGVFAGSNMNTYLLNNIYSRPDIIQAVGDYQISVGNGQDFLCTRVSYKLNLRGPSITVQTGCSSALVATAMAYQSLLNYQADMALAGGVAVWAEQKTGYLYQEGGISSPDGHCRAFDAGAQGTVMGNGLAVVLLKRLEDALVDGDHIYAVIRGAAVNNDGSIKVGFTAPSVDGQAEVIMIAQGLAEVEPETIGYIEAHGTGTPLGDPIEIAALTKAFRAGTDKKRFCAIGSVKTNIGHLDSAAGGAGLIKAALALKHQTLPPSLHFEKPNPQTNLEESPFYVNDRLQAWPATEHPRRAGVSSFGIGGTNAHVVLEEAPQREPSAMARPVYPLLISARSHRALEAATARLADHWRQHPELNVADVAYTLLQGRKAFNHRRALLCGTSKEAIRTLETPNHKQVFTEEVSISERPVVFMFSGQGAQYVNMGRGVYETEKLFRELVDHCSTLLEPALGLSFRDVIYPSASEVDKIEESAELLKQTWLTQPALFVIEYALARLWMSWGIEPQAMVGHSIGEYVVACLAGVFSLEDALSLVMTRGRLMHDLPGGAMLSVVLSEAEVRPWLNEHLSLAVVNGPSNCVVSGSEEAIAALEEQLAAAEVVARRLHTSHAFHSHMMAPILDTFRNFVAQIERRPPQIPCLSNLSGDWLTNDEAQDPAYWANQLRQTVRFDANVQKLAEHPDWALLEVGPGHTLRSLARRQLDRGVDQLVLASLPHPKEAQRDYAFLLQSWARLWLAGVALDGEQFYAGERRYRVPLPTYPFERRRYWVEPGRRTVDFAEQESETEQPAAELVGEASLPSSAPAAQSRNGRAVEPGHVEHTLARIWTELIGVEDIAPDDNFFDLGGDSLTSVQVAAKARQAGLELSPAQLFEHQTIAELAAVITPSENEKSQNGAASRFLYKPRAVKDNLPNLVQLQAGSGKRPLFMVHPASGDALSYRRLARYLGEDQPVYGFVASGLYDDGPITNDFRWMALQYARMMMAVQPEGPFHLAGWSAGGTLAFEMATKLRRLGRSVAFLGLIDAGMADNQQNLMRLAQGLVQSNKWLGRLHGSGTLGRRLFQAGIKRLWQQKQEEIAPEMARQNEVAVLMLCLNWFEEEQRLQLGITPDALMELDREERFAYVQESMQRAGVRSAAEQLSGIRRWVDVTLTNSALVDSYKPSTYKGEVTFFRAADRVPDEPAVVTDFSDDTLGWARYCARPVTVHKVPGHHYVLMDEPHVRVLAERLRGALDEAETLVGIDS